MDSGQRLESHRLTGAAGSGAVALGDLDGDGDLDAMAATASGAAIWTNRGGAQGGQEGVLAGSGLCVGRGYVEAVFADLDADGDLDALVSEKSPVSVWLDAVIADGEAQASVWWNDGLGSIRVTGDSTRLGISQPVSYVLWLTRLPLGCWVKGEAGLAHYQVASP